MKNRKFFEVIGLFSVVGSLIFVGIEIKQNTTAVRGATQQAVSSQVAEMYRILAENERMANLVSIASKGVKDMRNNIYCPFLSSSASLSNPSTAHVPHVSQLPGFYIRSSPAHCPPKNFKSYFTSKW